MNPVTKLARNLLREKVAVLAFGKVIIRDALDLESEVVDSNDIILEVHDMRFYVDVMMAGSNGAASAFRDGYWSCNNLTALFQLMVRNLQTMDKMESGLATIGNWWLKRRHKARSNTRDGSRKNIQAHYDLGNNFFELMLDKTMTYSSGYFLTEDSSMEEASFEKLDRICRKLKLSSSHRVLEIGTGWGSFAIHAARNYGCHVTTTTISKQQFKLANQRVREANLENHIDIQLCDYRDLTGVYDRLISIEMIEAVGNEFLPSYFASCSKLLKEDGQACIQAITMPDQRYEQYLKNSDFIQQYIFPGSCVPSITAMQNAITAGSDLRISQLEDFGLHYAETLNRWRSTFLSRLDEVKGLGYSDDFILLWDYYLCYCEAGFRERYTGVTQIVLDKPAFNRAALATC
jgi:cyclopropane-fatty-acyl-phospholipid synthase